MDWEMLQAILRAQAWERAKGEMQSVLVTFYQDKRFDTARNLILEFIKQFEDEGCHE